MSRKVSTQRGKLRTVKCPGDEETSRGVALMREHDMQTNYSVSIPDNSNPLFFVRKPSNFTDEHTSTGQVSFK